MSSAALARRAVASGSTGAVAAASRAAAAVGAAALLDGGNAFDAAVAAALVETVVLPSKCGLAGDVVALYVPAAGGEPVSLIALGGAPEGLLAAADDAGWQVPATGPLSVGVPGAPAGYDRLAALGRLGRERLAAPAAALARRGVWWSPLDAMLTAESHELVASFQPGGTPYTPPHAHRAGDLVPFPGLAEALDEFARRGADLLAGPVGDDLLDCVGEAGGVLAREDLARLRVREESAPRFESGHGALWTTGAPTYGMALGHAFDGRAEVGPAEVAQALTELARGDLGAPKDEGTSTIAACDAEGNAVVLVHSLSFPQYGSGLVSERYGLILNNRAGRGFTFAPGHPNSPAPGRQPLTTLHAWALRHETGWLLGATPGGQQQVPWNAQLLTQLWRTGLTEADLGDALVTPRWLLDPDGGTRHEGVDLPALGARVSHALARTAPGRATAAADPRWDGEAIAL